MKISVLSAMLAGFFAAIGGLHASEPTTANAGPTLKASCFANCQTREAQCSILPSLC